MIIWEAFDDIIREYNRSVDLHGDWADYTTDQMMSVIINELMVEAGEAEASGDLYGKHGVVRELAQVAACCMKAIIVLSDREVLLAGASRPEGAHSGSTGRALPASPPPIPQDKESYSNSPEEVSDGPR